MAAFIIILALLWVVPIAMFVVIGLAMLASRTVRSAVQLSLFGDR